MGVVLLPRRSGTLSSSLLLRQLISHQHNSRPRITHAQCPCGLSHRRLRFASLGVNPFCRFFHNSCILYHQWLLELGTLHHWKWNTIDCSSHDSYGCEGLHSRRLATLCCLTSSWKRIPVKYIKQINNWIEVGTINIHIYTFNYLIWSGSCPIRSNRQSHKKKDFPYTPSFQFHFMRKQ